MERHCANRRSLGHQQRTQALRGYGHRDTQKQKSPPIEIAEEIYTRLDLHSGKCSRFDRLQSDSKLGIYAVVIPQVSSRDALRIMDLLAESF